MVDNTRHIITIDGPSGVGKGTLSQFLAKHLKWSFLDSGALYRVVAYYANSIGLEPEDLERLEKVEDENIFQVKLVDKIKDFKIEFRTDPPHPKWGVSVLLNGDDVTDYVRSEKCGKKASFFAKKQEVRSALFGLQRSFGAPNNLVADGRDMGRVVFPDPRWPINLGAATGGVAPLNRLNTSSVGSVQCHRFRQPSINVRRRSGSDSAHVGVSRTSDASTARWSSSRAASNVDHWSSVSGRVAGCVHRALLLGSQVNSGSAWSVKAVKPARSKPVSRGGRAGHT